MKVYTMKLSFFKGNYVSHYSKMFLQTAAAMAARVKCIKPILTVASKLGRSLAELFGLLGKLAVGRPIRQRFNR